MPRRFHCMCCMCLAVHIPHSMPNGACMHAHRPPRSAMCTTLLQLTAASHCAPPLPCYTGAPNRLDGTGAACARCYPAAMPSPRIPTPQANQAPLALSYVLPPDYLPPSPYSRPLNIWPRPPFRPRFPTTPSSHPPTAKPPTAFPHHSGPTCVSCMIEYTYTVW